MFCQTALMAELATGPTTERFLVTGSMGCIGAWVLKHLVAQGVSVVGSDLVVDPTRPRLLMTDDELAQVTWAELDVTDLGAVHSVVETHGITHVVHLAGLQIPFCAANPSAGAAVNVVGTVNLLEGARHGGVRGFTYASSLAALGPAEDYPETPVADDVPLTPPTLYGVYKAANEETARIYWQDWQVGSVGLRPYTVYGVGRDQGMTADLAKAVLAAVAEEPFHVRFGGPVTLQHASDVAEMFIAAARAEYQGATVCNLRNDVIEVADFVDAVREQFPHASLTISEGNALPYPADVSDAGLRSIIGEPPHLPMDEAISQDANRYRDLIATGGIDMSQLQR